MLLFTLIPIAQCAHAPEVVLHRSAQMTPKSRQRTEGLQGLAGINLQKGTHNGTPVPSPLRALEVRQRITGHVRRVNQPVQEAIDDAEPMAEHLQRPNGCARLQPFAQTLYGYKGFTREAGHKGLPLAKH
jgi:hypothetical protein